MYGARLNRHHSRNIGNPDIPGLLLDRLEEAGVKLPGPVAKARRAATDGFEHIRSTIAAVNDDQAVRQEAVTALADGTATPSQVLNASLTRIGTTQRESYGTILHDIQESARNAVAHRLHAAIKGVGEDWITKHMRPVAEDLIAELRAADIVQIELDRKTHLHGLESLAKRPDIAEAWEKLGKINSTADQLRVLGVIPSKLDDRDVYEFQGPPDERGINLHTFSVWTLYARMGHKPGLYTQAEVDEHFKAEGIERLTEGEARRLRQQEMDRQRHQAQRFASSHPGRL